MDPKKLAPIAHPPLLDRFTSELLSGTFGRSPLFGGPAPLFNDTEADKEPLLPRSQWVAQEAAEQQKKSVEQLAKDNANLQYDLRVARSRFDPDTQVAVSKEDHAALTTYRELFPTPKDAKDASKSLTELQDKDTRSTYDKARDAALAKYKDLPEAYKKLIPTSEELLKQPGGKEWLTNLDFLAEQVQGFAAASGATETDPAQRDLGVPPNSVKASGQGGNAESEGKKAGQGFWEARAPKPTT